MARARKLTPEQVQQAAADRRNGMSWSKLRLKYGCATNTVRQALYEYSDEFNPIRPVLRSELEVQLATAQKELEHLNAKVDAILSALKKRFNLHV